jgi:hypothetical protein
VESQGYNFEEVRAVLNLAGRKLTKKDWTGWTRGEAIDAVDWAAARHIKKIDSSVHVPVIPGHVRKLKTIG